MTIEQSIAAIRRYADPSCGCGLCCAAIDLADEYERLKYGRLPATSAGTCGEIVAGLIAEAEARHK